MNSFIVLSALIAVSSAALLVPSAHLVAPAAYIPSSRFTRADWSLPTQVHVPAVARYNVVRPAYTTIHQAAPLAYTYAHAPVVSHSHVVAHSPVVAHAPLVAAARLVAPATYSHEITQTIELNKKA
ncbi:hypothetical protein HDE_09937 [Halotydeus destructor]|nr:hypothetical protein HDE_09937 [Halotydeus destructor]